MLSCLISACFCFFFFNDTATTEIYTLSLHDALPIFGARHRLDDRHPRQRDRGARQPEGDHHRAQGVAPPRCRHARPRADRAARGNERLRSEEHTSELQSLAYLVCRLLLEKKKNNKSN